MVSVPVVPTLGKLRREDCFELEVSSKNRKCKCMLCGRVGSAVGIPACLQECAARGEDYEKVKLLEISAEDAERWERRKKKKNPDLGFSGTAGLR